MSAEARGGEFKLMAQVACGLYRSNRQLDEWIRKQRGAITGVVPIDTRPRRRVNEAGGFLSKRT